MAVIPERKFVERKRGPCWILAIGPSSAARCRLDEHIDEAAGLAPDRLPGLERGAPEVCNSVIATGRSRVRRYHATREQPVRTHLAQDRIEHALLDAHGGRNLLQLL